MSGARQQTKPPPFLPDAENHGAEVPSFLALELLKARSLYRMPARRKWPQVSGLEGPQDSRLVAERMKHSPSSFVRNEAARNEVDCGLREGSDQTHRLWPGGQASD